MPLFLIRPAVFGRGIQVGELGRRAYRWRREF
ncbi:MAG: hypothetical protein RIS92_1862 [Verrucomicrobiota bacterium]